MTKLLKESIITSLQTVDAEIKPYKTTQRARGAESRVRHRLANGPQRAQSKARAEYSATPGQALLARDMIVSLKVRVFDANQGGTADNFVLFVLGRDAIFLPGAFFVFPSAKRR